MTRNKPLSAKCEIKSKVNFFQKFTMLNVKNIVQIFVYYYLATTFMLFPIIINHIKWHKSVWMENRKKNLRSQSFRIKLLHCLKLLHCYVYIILGLPSFFDDAFCILYSITFDCNIPTIISFFLTMNWKFFKRKMVRNFFIFNWSSG